MRPGGPFQTLILGLAAAASSPAFAETSRLDAILSAQVLRVGTTGDYQPFSALDKTTGAYSGFDVDMARALAEALGVRLTFVPTAWPNLAQDLKAGAFDIAMGGVSVTLTGRRSASSPIPTSGTARRRLRVAPTFPGIRRSRTSTGPRCG